MVEFIHTSDWHLGNPFSIFSERQQEQLAEARFEALTGLFDYARATGVRLMLCAGDQIDNGELRDRRVLLRLFGIIASYPEIAVVMITGNHDPLTPSSVYLRVERSSYPENLRLLDRPEVIELPDHGMRILAAPLTERFGTSNPIMDLADVVERGAVQGQGKETVAAGGSEPSGGEDALVTIGLAHGSLAVSDAVAEGAAYPIPPQLAAQKGLDYLALGDWHSYLKADERTYYPGTHEPLAFADDAGSLHVTIAGVGRRPEVRRIVEPCFRWREIRRTLRDDTLEGFLGELAVETNTTKRGGDAWGGGAGRTIVRLHLEGQVSLERFKQLEERLAIEEARLFRLFVSKLPEIRPSEAELREIATEGYLPKVVAKLEELAAEGEETADVALLKIYNFFRRALR